MILPPYYHYTPVLEIVLLPADIVEGLVGFGAGTNGVKKYLIGAKYNANCAL